MQILLISDIHANFPALEAIDASFKTTCLDMIINCGDSLVYAPFPNETLLWLQHKKVVSILGNTDKKVIKLLQGKSFKKPAKEQKRCMYTWTAATITDRAKLYLSTLKDKIKISLCSVQIHRSHNNMAIGVYHGSPARNHEFLFNATPDDRFIELAHMCKENIVICGHSHDPFHKYINNIHFINPGSVGRMFDGNPDASCALLQLSPAGIKVQHFRIAYDITKTIQAIHNASLPEIYCDMYRLGRKIN